MRLEFLPVGKFSDEGDDFPGGGGEEFFAFLLGRYLRVSEGSGRADLIEGGRA